MTHKMCSCSARSKLISCPECASSVTDFLLPYFLSHANRPLHSTPVPCPITKQAIIQLINTMADPFDCFGSDDESETGSQNVDHESNQKLVGNTCSLSGARDEESCGVLAFHANTERSLLMHVKNSNKPENEIPCQHILNEIDWFCKSRHWMMNVGPEKGGLIQNSLREAIEKKQRLQSRSEGLENRKKFVAVELGTYCGYGSIFLSSLLKIHKEQYQDIAFNLFTVEINPEFSAIAKEMIQMAEQDDIVTVLDNDLLMDGSTGDVGELVKGALLEKFEQGGADMRIDFLMIDHDKDSYLADLKRLEKSGLIKRGTIVAADNVIFAGIFEYINYMQGLAKEGIVKTSTKEAAVEYSPKGGTLMDGVGKFQSCRFVPSF